MSNTNDHRDDDSLLIDLDDHRTNAQRLNSFRNDEQPLPMRARRGTFASIKDETLDIPMPGVTMGMTSRDFGDTENAIVDDDGQEECQSPRLDRLEGSGRRSTFRRKRPGVSRDSTPERGDSPSPPTSLHAFAEQNRLRGRAFTIDIEPPTPGIELTPIARTASNSTHPRRRPTFSEVQSENGRASMESSSTDSSVENDVCYPQNDHISMAEGKIDIEELIEYVQEFEEAARPGRSSPEPLPGLPAKSYSEPAIPVISSGGETSDFGVEDEKAEAQAQAQAQVPSRPATINNTAPEQPKPFFTFFSSDYEDAVHSNSLGGLLADGETFESLFKSQNNGGCWWLDVSRPTEDLVTALCKGFGVHPLTREDISMQESREKVELFDNYYFVAFRSFENDDKNSDSYLEPVNVYAVVYRYGLITFQYKPMPHTSNVLRRIGKLRDHMHVSADWICYALIDDIVDYFMPVIREIEVEVDTIEDSVFTAHYEDARPILKAIGDARKRVMVLIRLLGGKSDVIKGFAKRCNENYSVAPRGDVGLYLSDIQDHIVTMRDNLNHSEQLLSRTHNNFLAQINVDSINDGNKVNQLLGKITLVATIVVPMNLLTGLFGMNVRVPGQDDASLAWFFGVAATIVLLCAIAFITVKRLRLI